MANKTVDPILSTIISQARGASSATQQALHDEASRQLYEAEIERIGDDEPNTTPAALWCNATRAKLRAKARAFYGITETEEEG